MNIFGVIITKSSNLFSETFANNARNRPFIILSEVDSTNNYAMAKLHAMSVMPGTCFQAVKQTSGKGQRGRQWLADKGENITMSLCIRPVYASFPFLLSATMALGCYDFIKESGASELALKWPNDIYINDRKAAGILIETIYQGSTWEWAVVGVGVNVNQEHFDGAAVHATSLKLACNRTFDVTAAGRSLHSSILARLQWMQAQNETLILEAYNSLLFRKGKAVRIKKGAAVFITTIREVNASGELITEDTVERRFAVGEIEFV